MLTNNKNFTKIVILGSILILTLLFVPKLTAADNATTTSSGSSNNALFETTTSVPEHDNCPSDFSIKLPSGQGEIKFSQAGILGLCGPRPVLTRLIFILLTIAYILFVIAIIYSGIMLATADSDDKAVTAKKNLTWAVIGAIIVIAANWVVPTVIELVVKYATPTP